MPAMRKFVVKLVTNAVALWIASLVIHGITLKGDKLSQKIVTVLVVALIFGLVNTFIKPVVKLLSLGLFFVTLGLITFVINALMLLLTSAISGRFAVQFHVDGFVAALLGSLVITVVSIVLHAVIKDEKHEGHGSRR
jgi:putative membrane protein